MSEELRALLPPLDPPPGGLTRLRARIADERRSPRRPRVVTPALGLAATVVLAVVAFALVRNEPTSDLHAADTSLLRMRLGLVDPPAEPVTVPEERRGEMAVQRIDLDTQQVLYYLVSSNPSPH
jgi:hypothetical protein